MVARTVTCPHCNYETKHPGPQYVDDPLTCVNCGVVNMLRPDELEATNPVLPPIPPPLPASSAVTEINWKSQFRTCYRRSDLYALLLLTFMPCAMYLLYAWDEWPFGWLLAVLVLSFLTFISLLVPCDRRAVYLLRITVIPWALVVAFSTPFYLKYATIREYWDRKDGDTEISYHDTYRRFGRKLIYRRMTYRFGKDGGRSMYVDGPFAGDDRQHGKWETVVFDPEYKKTIQYYWYGERITEGEWHLRNK